MKIYNYHSATKEFLGESEAFSDPLNPSEYLIPARATTVEPMPKLENKTAVFDAENQNWKLVDDFRGLVIFEKATGKEKVIDILGEIPNFSTHTINIPQRGEVEWDEENQNWKSKLPLAMGRDLIEFLNQKTIETLSDDQVISLQQALAGVVFLLTQGRCNPLSAERFASLGEKIASLPLNGTKNAVLALTENWAETVRFAE